MSTITRTRPPLPLRAEIGRQLRRRRTIGIFVVLTILPLVLLLAFWLGDDGNDSGQRGFVDLAQESGANLVIFTLFASTSFLLIVIVALFAGDTVPSEASWASLRYLLAAPVRRERLLRQKLVVAALSSVVAFGFLPGWTLLMGGIAYGWGPYVGPTGSQIGWPQFAGRLLIIVCYLLLAMSVVGAFAFMLGVLTDAPLAAVGGAVLLMILCAILDSITALGNIRRRPARSLRVRLARCPCSHHRLFGHDHRCALVDRVRHHRGLARLLVLPAQGHHQLRARLVPWTLAPR